MHLVEVDLVDAEPAQAGVAGGADAVGREPLAAGVGDREAHLGGEHDLVAVVGEPRRERLLRAAVVVGVGGVDEVAAGVEEAVEHPVGLVDGRLSPMSIVPRQRRETVKGPSGAVSIRWAYRSRR